MPFKHINIDPQTPMTFKVPMICQYTKLPGTFLTEIKAGIVRDNEIVKAPERTVFVPIYEGIYAYKPRNQPKDTLASS